MKARKNELNVDFIGGAGPLTKEEEKRISDVIKKLKAKKGGIRKSSRKLTTKKEETT